MAASLLVADRLAAQISDPGMPRVRFRLDVPRPVAPRLADLDDGGRLGRRLPAGVWGTRWRARVDAAATAARDAGWRQRLLTRFGIRPPAVTPPDLPVDSVPLPPPTLQGLARYADLNVELTGRLEAQVDQLRNLNCSAVDFSNLAAGCQGGFPTPQLGQQFQLRAGGVIADRLNLNVDFDSEREFSANNAINVWYQGFEDEIVKRVEVGNLDFRLPETRFISSAIPANSFGVQGNAQLGPLEFSAILAQQKGSSVRSRVFTVGAAATQRVTTFARDVDFEVGRFFFVVDPRSLPQYPAIDVLDLANVAVPPTLRPRQVRVYRLRPQTGQVGVDPNLGGIDAVARRDDSSQRVGPFPWELLIEGQDYYLDPSGLWFGLGNRVGNEEYLAVSYVTAAGDTVGTFPAVNGSGDTLQLIHEPRRGPEVPTFFYEMRNFYRIGGANVTRETIQLALLVNESEQPLAGNGTYLSLFDLTRATDPSTLDDFNRVFPRERDPNRGAPIRDLFLVFRHLAPFADGVILAPPERNDSLYRVPAYLLSSEAPATVFRFDWAFDATGSGDRSQLSLGAIQVADGSERIRINNRDLLRGRDYDIDYDLGIVTFANPDSLFRGPTQVQVLFEENQLFDVAPRNVLGFATTYNLGSRGRIDAIGLFQRERTIFSRPGLGFEPQAMFMGGLTADFDVRLPGLTRFLDGLPFLRTTVPSMLELNGELAMSRPNPNQAGAAYIEEFESRASRSIDLQQSSFQLGSRPRLGRGIPGNYLSGLGEVDPGDAVPLVWQNAIEVAGGALVIGPQEIDSSIVLTGSSQPSETVLWLTLKPDTVGGAPDPVTGAARWIRPSTPGPRWRAISQPLDRSGLGVDLTRAEFLEFWLLEDFARTPEQQETILIFDFGTVLEDAEAFGPDSFRVANGDTTFFGFQSLGQGRLDSEEDSLTNTFNAAVDDIGIHGDLVPSIVDAATGVPVRDLPLCEQGFFSSFPVFPLGSLRARCTRLNGLVDTEDLNGDNRLDITLGPEREDYVRFVVPIGDPRFVVRTGVTLPDVDGRSMTWRLYRIPFREDTVQVGTPNLRQIPAVRLTVMSPAVPDEQEVSFALARMTLVGAQWLKRAQTPIPGFGGSLGAPHGEVLASVISTENAVDLGYTSPPGVIDEAGLRGAALGLGTQQINEKSLRLLARDLRVGERAEAFIRFTDATERNFLQYRNLRVWARGRGAGWEDRDLQFFVKVGTDEDNFYLYLTDARSVDWEPEVVVELERWLALRAEVEASWLRGDPPSGAAQCGGNPAAYVACDGPYLVQVLDPGVSPPNLARVSEVAAGMFRARETVAIATAELWVDDIRLTEVVSDAGMAGAFDARLTAADFAEVNVSITGRDDRFRQIDEVPDYQGAATTRLTSVVQVDRLLPQRWGLNIPFTYQYQRSDVSPFFVRNTDVRAAALPGLREPGSTSTFYQLALRRARRGATLLERVVLDPVSVSVSKQSGNATTERTTAVSDNRRLQFGYDTRPGPVSVRGAPGFLSKLVQLLPRFIRNSEFARALETSRLRLNPQMIRFVSTVVDNETQRFAFRVPVLLDTDSLIRPLRSTFHTWRNEVGVDLRPYSSFSLRFDYASTRDLHDYGDSTSVARLIQNDRRSFLGRDVGFERSRTMSTNLSMAPVINSWLRPRVNFGTDFVFNRDPNARRPVLVPSDSTTGLRVPESVSNARTLELGSTFDLARFVSSLTGGSSPVARLVQGILPADVAYTRELGSVFDRTIFAPTTRFQFALGGVDEFREQEGSLATSALESGRWTAVGGTQLPLGFRVRLNYQDLTATNWLRLADGQAVIIRRSREWPSAFFTWVYTPSWKLGDIISSITAQTQYRRSDASSVLPVALTTPGVPADEANATITETERRALTPSVTITWVSGVVTTAQYRRTRTDIVTSGNVTRNDDTGWAGSLSFSVRPPAALMRLPSDIRTSLAVNTSDQVTCLQRPDAAECSTVSDSRRRQLDVRVDTAFPPSMRGGASFSYLLTDQRHTSSKFSQVVFTVFLELNFLASQIR